VRVYKFFIFADPIGVNIITINRLKNCDKIKAIIFKKKALITCEIKKNHYFCTRFEREANQSEHDFFELISEFQILKKTRS